NALPMTFAFVPGGPEATTNGLGNLKPSTVMLRSDIVILCAAKGVQVTHDFQRARFVWVADMLTPRPGFDPGCVLLQMCQGLFRWRPRRSVGFRVLIILRISVTYHCLSRDPATARNLQPRLLLSLAGPLQSLPGDLTAGCPAAGAVAAGLITSPSKEFRMRIAMTGATGLLGPY